MLKLGVLIQFVMQFCNFLYMLKTSGLYQMFLTGSPLLSHFAVQTKENVES